MEKLTYNRPELRFLGDLQEMTAGKKGSRFDHKNPAVAGSHKKPKKPKMMKMTML